MTGAVLLILLAVEGYTILRIGRLLTLHVFLGMLLLGPVTLKAGSVLYRFARYYAGSEPYRRKGPPAPLLRIIGPINMLLTACVLGSGIMLAVTGPGYYGGGAIRVAGAAPAFVHRLALLHGHPRARLRVAAARGCSPPRCAASPSQGGQTGAGRRTRRAVEVLGGRGTRVALLVASLLAGLVIALLTVHLAGKWERASARASRRRW